MGTSHGTEEIVTPVPDPQEQTGVRFELNTYKKMMIRASCVHDLRISCETLLTDRRVTCLCIDVTLPET